MLAIDRDHKCVDAVADLVTRAVTANFQEQEVLRELGVAECDCVILGVGSDLALSVMTVMNLKAIGAKRIICKAYDDMYKEVLLRLGADEVILPESDVADKLSLRLLSSHLVDYLALSDRVAIEEYVVPGAWCGKPIGELKIRNRYHVNIIAFRRGGDTRINLDADTVFEDGDILVMLGQVDDLEKIMRLK